MTYPWANVREILKRIAEVQTMGLKANPSVTVLREVLTDADALLAVVREPYQPTFDDVMSRLVGDDEIDEYTVSAVIIQVRKLIRKSALAALPEHLKR